MEKKKSDGVRLDLPGQREFAKRHRKLALAKEVFIISKKVIAAAPFVGSQLEALINVAEHIIAEVERNHREREAERQLALHVCQVIQRIAKLLDDRDIEDAPSLKEDLEDALPIFQTIHRVLIFRAKQSLRMRFRIGTGSGELSSLSTQLDRIMINMTFSSTARTEIATRKLLRANSQAPENIAPPYSEIETAEVHANEMYGKRAGKRHRTPSEDEETSYTKRRISGAFTDMHQLGPEGVSTSAIEAYEAVTVHLESIKRVDGTVEQSAEIKVRVGQPEDSGIVISEVKPLENIERDRVDPNGHRRKRSSLSPKRSQTHGASDITKRRKVGLSAIGRRLGLLRKRGQSK